MHDSDSMTAIQIRDAVQRREKSCREVIDATLARIERLNPALGAFLSVDAEGARASADALDERIRGGWQPGPLAGVPVAIKDNICIEGAVTTCASRTLRDYRPPYNATVIDRLLEAGAILVGKTNLDEFAMGSSTENSALGITRNPWDRERIPGGSSGGSAAAVASGMVPLALGSDTGGSIRAPASFCGCVGMKPTYGTVSRFGLVAFGSSLDQIGPFARTVEDAALLLSVIAGPDACDATCRRQAAPDYLSALREQGQPLRIGLPEEYFATEGLSPLVRQTVTDAVERLKDKGAEIRPVHLPMVRYAVPTYYVIATAEASSNLARYDGVHYGHRAGDAKDIIDLFSRSREESFGPEVKRRIMLGTYVLSAGYYDAYYLRALKVRTRIAEDFARAFAEVDAIASPVAPTTAFRLGEKVDDPVSMYLSDIYTISANLAAIPAVSVPCGSDDAGLPIGLQFMAPRFADALVLQAAAQLETTTGWANRVAPCRG